MNNSSAKNKTDAEDKRDALAGLTGEMNKAKSAYDEKKVVADNKKKVVDEKVVVAA